MLLKGGIEAGNHRVERLSLALPLPVGRNLLATGPDHEKAQQPHGRDQRDRGRGAVNSGLEEALAFQCPGPEVKLKLPRFDGVLVGLGGYAWASATSVAAAAAS